MALHLSCWLISLGLFSTCHSHPLLWSFWPSYNRSPTAATPATTSSRGPSNVVISIGNRVNTTAGLDDNGTTINGLTINLTRWNGSLKLAANGSDIEIASGTNETTIIRIDLSGFANNATEVRSINDTIAATEELLSRRKRALPVIPGIPSLSIPPIPSFPLPTLNGSSLSINGNTITLPSSITNLTIITNDPNRTSDSPGTLAEFAGVNAALQQPWQFFKLLLERRFFPVRAADPLVTFLSQQYSSNGRPLVEAGVTALDTMVSLLNTVLLSALDFVDDQVSLGLQTAVRLYNRLTLRARTCVGEVPEDSGRRVVESATDCARERWDDLSAIVEQFRALIVDTDDDFQRWLQQLIGCNAQNFETLSGEQLETAQRRCYVQALASPASRMTADSAIRWADLSARVATTVSSFQPQIALCVAHVGAEVAAISTNISLRTALCQLIP